MSIERDLTHAAFTEFLATQPTLAPLATELNDTVDGNATCPRSRLRLSDRPNKALLILIS